MKIDNLVESQYIQTLRLSEKTPLWEYWSEFVLHYEREGKSEVTLIGVRNALRFIIKHCGIFSIEQCNTPRILREALFQAKEERVWSNTTFNTYRKNINTYFRWLEDMEYVEENKIGKIRKCKEVQNEQLTLKEEQVKEIRAHIMSRRNTRFQRWRNLLLFDMIVLTGARPCEIAEIEMKDIKQEDNGYKIAIQGRKQKGRIRYYRLPSSVRDTYEMFVSIRQDLGREETYLFCSQSKRTGLTYKGINGFFKKLSKELGYQVTAYSIRRFVATKLYEEDVPLKHIQQHLGHTRQTTTLRYIEHTCALTNKGVLKIEQALFRP